MKKSGRIMLGLAALFAAGALVGALYAPDKGERTRRRIVRKGRRLCHSLNDTLSESADSLEEMRDYIKAGMEQLNNEINKMKQDKS